MKAKKQQQQQQGSKGSDRKSPKATVKGGRGDDKKDKGEGSSKLSEKPDSSSHGGIVSDSRARDMSSIKGQSTCESWVGRGATPKKDECLCVGQCMVLRYPWLNEIEGKVGQGGSKL